MVVNGKILRVPLVSYRVVGIDQTLVRAVLPVQIRTGLRGFVETEFVVDSAAAITSIAVAKATQLGIPVPRKAVELGVETATGPARQVRHPGRIQGRIQGLEGWMFDWPCHFVAHRGPPPKAVLGLTGVLNDLRITLDGTHALEAPYGWLILERIR